MTDQAKLGKEAEGGPDTSPSTRGVSALGMIFLSLLAPVCALRARGVSLLATREEVADPQPPTLVVPSMAQGVPVAVPLPNDSPYEPQTSVPTEVQRPVAQQVPQVPSLPGQSTTDPLTVLPPQGGAPQGAAQSNEPGNATGPVAPQPIASQMPQPYAETQVTPGTTPLPPQKASATQPSPRLQSQQQQHRQQEVFMDVFKAARAKQIPADAANDPGRDPGQREREANPALDAVAASSAAAVHWKVLASSL